MKSNTRGCKFKGCPRRPTAAQVLITARTPGREGRAAGGVIQQLSSTLCEFHLDVVMRRIGSWIEDKPPLPR